MTSVFNGWEARLITKSSQDGDATTGGLQGEDSVIGHCSIRSPMPRSGLPKSDF